MSDKKHIDRLFQEKFKDFDVSPDPTVWNGIEARLEKKKRKRRVIPIWWQMAGVAAALVLLFAVGNSLFTNNNSDEIPIIVNTENKNEENTIKTKNNDSLLKKNNIEVASENSLKESSNTDLTVDSKNKEKKQLNTTNNSESIIASQNSTVKNKNESYFSSTNNINNTEVIATVSKNDNTSENSNTKAKLKSDSEIKALLKSDTTKEAIATSEKNETTDEEKIIELETKQEEKGQDIEKAIAEANTTNEKEEEKLRRWSVAPNVAPVLFNSFGEGSSIDNQFNNNNKTSDITLSVGIKGSYAINNRLKVTAGVNRVNFNTTTTDIIALSDNSFASRANNNNLENVKLNGSVNDASLTVMSRTSINEASIPGAINTIQTGNLNQNFGFIEIPLEVEYRVLDNKIGLNLSGGFSTFLLNENEIFADVNGESTSIGEANNINDTSFSANIGIGLDYGITDKININLEPKFKYQLNTFNNTSGDFRPFFVGVYTGLSFKF